MTVKQGYKYTEEFGYIPNDWEIKYFGNCFKFLKSYPFSREELTTNGIIKYIHYGDIHGYNSVWLNCDINLNVFLKKNKMQKYEYLQTGDLIFVDASEDYDGVTKCIELKTSSQDFIISGLHTIPLRPKEKLFALGFIGYLSSILLVKNQFIKYATGMKVVGISKTNLKQISFPLPPIHEQEKIAQVLFDTDKLLESIENLLEKKRNLKIATMQKLLTPQPHWEEKKLRDIVGIITTGKLDANAMVKNGIYRFYTCAKEFYWINKYAFEGSSILISGNGANVGYIHYYCGKFNAYQRTYVLQQFYCEDKFLKFFLDKNLSKRIEEDLNSSNTPFIKKSTLTNMVILLPPIQEQQQIVQILSDMDKEIEILEKELEKYKMIKIGAMQELLTGKTRLV